MLCRVADGSFADGAVATAVGLDATGVPRTGNATGVLKASA